MLYERSPRCGQPRSPWAIKKLNKKATYDIADRLEKEADILKKIKHPNIIGYRGFKRHSNGIKILAVENGQRALFDVIEEFRDELKKNKAEKEADKENTKDESIEIVDDEDEVGFLAFL